MLDIVNARMADAIRTITIRRGIDPRDFSLFAYGGAGPMHAVALAEELDICEVIVPGRSRRLFGLGHAADRHQARSGAHLLRAPG